MSEVATQSVPRHRLRSPGDLAAAHKEWGCNCGPSALAAALNLRCADVRDAFGDFDERRYVNPSHMKAAAGVLGYRALLTERLVVGSAPPARHPPLFGVAFIQFTGPQVPQTWHAQYLHTHWIACAFNGTRTIIYDCNHAVPIPLSEWAIEVFPRFESDGRPYTGFYIRTAYQLVKTTAP